MGKSVYPPEALSWIVWGLGAAFYFTGFYQRVAPAVMADRLMADFHIGAAALGHFSAFYFYSYVAVQIPTGILADRLGPRRLLTCGCLVAALGTLLFGTAQSLGQANAGRLLIGAAVGVAWICLLKIAVHWFPPRRYAMTGGLALLCGVAGAVSAGVPLRIMLEALGWRPVMTGLAFLTLALAAVVWMVVRDDPAERGYSSFAPQPPEGRQPVKHSALRGLQEILRYRNTWLISLAPAGIVGPILAFSGLWGVPFLVTHYGLSPAHSAGITSALMVSWAVGGPVLGSLSDRIGLRKPLYLSGCALACAGWFLILYQPKMPVWALLALVIVVGFSSGAMIIGFAFIKESVPVALAGTVSGVCNMGVMLGPMILQPAMGWMLDHQWQGAVENGIRIYQLGAYRNAFALMLGWSLLSIILIGTSSETHCRQPAPGQVSGA